MSIFERLKRRITAKKDLEIVEPPDGRWGWVVCAAAFVTQFMVLGTMNNFGILYVDLFEAFGGSASKTSLIGSINYGMMFFMGPIAATMSSKYGCRPVSMTGGIIFSLGLALSSFAPNLYTLYFTYGIMIGFGASLCYFSTIVAVGKYFYRRLSLANGIISSGSGIGSLVMGPVLNNLLKAVGWRNTLRIYSGMMLIVCLNSLLFRPINSHIDPANAKNEESKANKKVKLIDLKIFLNKSYIIWCVSLSVFILGYFVPFVHLVKYAQNNGVSRDDSSYLIGIMSVGSTGGRLFFGKLSDYPKVNRLYIYQLSILCMGVSNTLLPLMTTKGTIILYCIVWGAFEGCYVALCAVLTADIVGRDKLSSGVGMLFGIKSIPLTCGPFLAGIIYELSHSYDVAFYIAGAVCTLCCCIMFLIPLYMPCQEVVVEYIVDDSLADDNEKLKMNGKPDNVPDGKLEQERRSDDSAYVSEQPSAALISSRPRPRSSYLSPSNETNLVPSPSSLSLRGTLSRSTVSLTSKFLDGISKKARNSEFGSMNTIPIIPSSGTYKSLQQLPVKTPSVHFNTSKPNDEENVADAANIPMIVVSNGTHDLSNTWHNDQTDILDNEDYPETDV